MIESYLEPSRVESPREKTSVYSPLHETENTIGQIVAIAVRIGPRVESFLVMKRDTLVRTADFDAVGHFSDAMEKMALEQDVPVKDIIGDVMDLASRTISLNDDKNERLSLVLITQILKTTFLETDQIYI